MARYNREQAERRAKQHEEAEAERELRAQGSIKLAKLAEEANRRREERERQDAERKLASLELEARHEAAEKAYIEASAAYVEAVDERIRATADSLPESERAAFWELMRDESDE